MVFKRKRIGFLFASIHTGSALNLWTSLVQDMSSFEDAFFIFPGGRLNVVDDSEYLRNSIYSLANKQNLDGLISWGSAIGSATPVQELNRFHYSFEDLPYVTIAHKMPGHSCVNFNAYNGMAKLVKHFIEVHGCKKIAFIRGPSHHVSSLERYKAYCDVMQSAGINVKNSLLVTDPFNWSEGELAVQQLYVERKLEPGRDFEVLIGSSDMITFSAVTYLINLGYKVPQDFKCAGFNDSPESRILGAAFSTVHLPYTELALTALQMIRDQLDERKKGEHDVMLDSNLVIRESCGCPFPIDISSFIPNDAIQQDSVKNEQELIQTLSALFKVDETGTNSVIEPIINLLNQQNIPLLFTLFEKALERFFQMNTDIRLLYKAINIVKTSVCVPKDFFSLYESRILLTISLVQNRIHESFVYAEHQLRGKLNLFKCDLLAARSRKDLLSILLKHLPLLDICTSALVVYHTDTSSRFIGGFSNDTLYSSEIKFSSNLLLPDGIEGFSSGVFLVQPLFMEKEPLGYFICSVPSYDGIFFEELRLAISSAISEVFLFEGMVEAKQKAEEAKEAKSRFFANVGTDLIEPFEDISCQIKKIQQVLTDNNEQKSIKQKISDLSAIIDKQKEKTSFIVDLTLTQTNDLKLKRTLVHIESLINPSSKDVSLPLIFADVGRLMQALKILSNVLDSPLASSSAKKTNEGLVLVIPIKYVNEEIWQENSILLAESILLLHGASLVKKEKACHVVFPWPLFSCKNTEPTSPLYEWNEDESDMQQLSMLYARRDTPPFSQSAFLCTTSLSNSELAKVKTFASLFEKKLSSEVENPILFIGSSLVKYPLWAPSERSVFIPTIQEFEQVVQNNLPSIIVLDAMVSNVAEYIRTHPLTVMVPLLVLPEQVNDNDEIQNLLLIPRVIVSNRYIAQSEEFASRIHSLLSGDDILPADTGALVKKAIFYLNKHAGSQISRWKLADYVHVSEDYLTRIFHKEIGLSPWEYLTRHRIFLASQMLLHTNCTVYEVAEKCGFQDQAYFCRVFKKVTGVPPRTFRSCPEKGL